MLSWFQIIFGYLVPPALAAVFGGYAVHRWKGRSDYIEKRLDELCAIVADTADLASDYWNKDQTNDARLEEAKIMSGLAKVAGLRVLLESFTSSATGRELQLAEAVFLRETTGGNFGVHDRTADLDRVSGCQHAAAMFIVVIRAMSATGRKCDRRTCSGA